MNNPILLMSEHYLINLNNPGVFIHGLIALVSILLTIWWTKKNALMSFRAWSMFMALVHILYFFMISKYIRDYFGITMRDIYFLRGIEALATFITMLRLYFIMEAHNIDISNKNIHINPISCLTSAFKNAISTPEDPQEINGNKKKRVKIAKTFKEKLFKLLF